MLKDLADIVKTTKTLKLLYVEDDDEIRAATLKMLDSLFGTIYTANSGLEGLTLYEEVSPDIIITDLTMPVMSGLEMIAKIRETNQDIPIIVFSANDESQYFIQSIRLGVNGYALKPIDLTLFLNMLKQVIEAFTLKRTVDFQNVLMQQYMEITDKSSIVSKTNPDGIITYVNDSFCTLTGYAREELLGQTHLILSHPDADPKEYKNMWHQTRVGKKLFQGILKNINKNGSAYYSKTTIMPLCDSNGKLIECIGVHTDVTEMMYPSHQLADYLQLCDNPTVAIIKIEGFSDLQTFFGDIASEEIAEHFIKHFTPSLNAMAAHVKFFTIGGGNVVLASDNVDTKQFHTKLKLFQEHVYKNSINIHGINHDISVIISVASGDMALQDARAGSSYMEKNLTNFIDAQDFNKQMKKDAQKNLDTLHKIKSAIENDRIVSYFQPIIDNISGDVVKYESLVRLVDEDDKILSPFHFLEVAKKGKLYTQITHIVLKHSFKALVLSTKEISINLSIQDIEREVTRNIILDTLEEHKHLAHRVIFELLEDETVSDFAVIQKFIQDVKAFGVQIAIDDFGSGYSNYERLIQYQPDILKIDGSLIKTVHKDKYVESIVKSIITFAEQNNMKIVAEFVEDDQIFSFVKHLGINYSQGYHFGKPDTMDKIL